MEASVERPDIGSALIPVPIIATQDEGAWQMRIVGAFVAIWIQEMRA
jgi:hypothetical protein